MDIPNSYYYAIEEEAEANNIENEEYLISDSDLLKFYTQLQNTKETGADHDRICIAAYNSMVGLGKNSYTYLLNDGEFMTQIVKDLIFEFNDSITNDDGTPIEHLAVTEFGETLIEDLPDSVDQLLRSLEIAPTIESVARKLPYLYNDLIAELYYCR